MNEKPAELTTRQAAELLAVDVSYVRRLLYNGRLEGRRLDGWQWLVSRSSLETFQAQRTRRRRAE